MKKVSIITVTYNVGSLIIPTIESIKTIGKEQIEYIVIDGQSKDETLEILNRYSDIIDIIVSEPDDGIYDAMNKGINLATGEWILFINCGDRLLFIPYDSLDVNCIAVAGCVQDENGNVFHPKYDDSLKYGNKIPHQALFYNRLYSPVFDVRFKIFADYDLNLKMYKKKSKIKLIDDIVAQHNLDGLSMDSAFFNEVYDVIYNNYGIFGKYRAIIYHKCSSLLEILGFSMK